MWCTTGVGAVVENAFLGEIDFLQELVTFFLPLTFHVPWKMARSRSKLWQIANLFTPSCLWKENSGSSHGKVPLPMLKMAGNKVWIEVNKTIWKYKTISEFMPYCNALLQITPNVYSWQYIIKSRGRLAYLEWHLQALEWHHLVKEAFIWFTKIVSAMSGTNLHLHL